MAWLARKVSGIYDEWNPYGNVDCKWGEPQMVGIRQRFTEPGRAVLLHIHSQWAWLIAVQKVFLEISKEQAVMEFLFLHLAGCWFFWFSAESLEGEEREPSCANYLSKGGKCSRGNSSQRWLTEIFRRINPIREAVCVYVLDLCQHDVMQKGGKSAQVKHPSNAIPDIWAPFFRAGAIWSP